MRGIIIAPFVAVFILGFALEISSIAQDASAKVINYADDMNNALDCALDGISIYKCSPNLPKYDFEQDAEEFIDVNKEFINELKQQYPDAMIIEQGDTVVIKLDRAKK